MSGPGDAVAARSRGGGPAFDTALAMDPITFEVLRNAFLNATEEMAFALRRAAYSTNIKTRADFSCAFFDRQARCIVQSFSQPPHLSSLKHIVPRAVGEYGVENLRPGDALVTNDPHRGSSHLNDVAFLAPVFVRERLIGFLANIAHHVDVGGSSPASLGVNTELFQEGLILPPVKVVIEGRLNEDLFKVMLTNVRAPRETGGDLRAQVAVNLLGARRINAVVERVGLETVLQFFDELLDYTERWTRREFRALPPGTFRAEGWRDGDGVVDEPVRLCAAVTFDDGRVTLDVTGSSPQRKGPLNATRANSYAGLALATKSLIDQRIQPNDGFYRALEVVGPDGTVLTAMRPAAVVGAWEVVQKLADVIFLAVAPALPDRVPAAGKGIICNIGWAGHDPRRREYYCYMETIAGGNGARPNKDGPDAVQTTIHNTENAPVEEVEVNYPFQVVRYELIQDSEGAGRYRGGLGVRRDFRFVTETSYTIMSDGTRFAPWGLFGGGPARPAHFVLDPDGAARRLPSKGTVVIPAGGVISIQTPGGGGYGPPLERDPGAVLEDVRGSTVSLGRARDVYGVVVDPERWVADEAATRQLRVALAGTPEHARAVTGDRPVAPAPGGVAAAPAPPPGGPRRP
jgi:N-methylhydantoinase B